jgi:hypothetical protein
MQWAVQEKTESKFGEVDKKPWFLGAKMCMYR